MIVERESDLLMFDVITSENESQDSVIVDLTQGSEVLLDDLKRAVALVEKYNRLMTLRIYPLNH